MKKTAVVLALLTSAGLTATASAQIKLIQLANIDVSGAVTVGDPNRIGTNVSTVAWNGSQLFIGGLNGSGASLTTGLREVVNPLSSPTLGPIFGARSTASTRGHTSLSIRGNELYAAWDNGAAALGGVSRWDTTSTGAAQWQANIRGGGTDFDPLFNVTAGASGNIGMALLGSGRRQLLNAATGAVIYSGGGGNAGFIFNNAPIGASVPPAPTTATSPSTPPTATPSPASPTPSSARPAPARTPPSTAPAPPSSRTTASAGRPRPPA